MTSTCPSCRRRSRRPRAESSRCRRPQTSSGVGNVWGFSDNVSTICSYIDGTHLLHGAYHHPAPSLAASPSLTVSLPSPRPPSLPVPLPPCPLTVPPSLTASSSLTLTSDTPRSKCRPSSTMCKSSCARRRRHGVSSRTISRACGRRWRCRAQSSRSPRSTSVSLGPPAARRCRARWTRPVWLSWSRCWTPAPASWLTWATSGCPIPEGGGGAGL